MREVEAIKTEIPMDHVLRLGNYSQFGASTTKAMRPITSLPIPRIGNDMNMHERVLDPGFKEKKEKSVHSFTHMKYHHMR